MTIDKLLKEAKAAYDAMTDSEKRAMAEAQRESWMRGMGPCKHGDYDWETCSECRKEYAKAGKGSGE